MANEFDLDSADLSGFNVTAAPAPAAAPVATAKKAPAAAPAPKGELDDIDLSAFVVTGGTAGASTPGGSDYVKTGTSNWLFSHLLNQESGNKQVDDKGRPITSKAGAIGVAQVMPGTAPEAAQLAGLPFDEKRYRTDKEYNKALGAAYFAKQLETFGSEEKALAAYNAGPDAMAKAQQRATAAGNPGGWLKYLPAETRAYVPAIVGAARRSGSTPGAAAVAGAGAASSGADLAAEAYDWRSGFQAAKPAGPGRTGAEALKDTALGVAGGFAEIGKAAGDLYGIFTGDTENIVSKLGARAKENIEGMQSPALQEKRAERKDSIDNAEGVMGKAWAAIASTLTDPALAGDMIASNIASLVPGAVAGRMVQGAVGGRAMLAAMEAGPISVAAREAIAKSAGSWGVGAAKTAGALQQGASVASQAYDDALKKPQATWDANPEYVRRVMAGDSPEMAKHALALDAAREALPAAIAISFGANSLPGGSTVERALVGGVARVTGGKSGVVGMAGRAAKGAAGEGLSEAIEEGGGQAAANLAMQRNVDASQDLTEGVGENAGLGAAGGILLGGPAGLTHAAHAPAPKTPVEQAVEQKLAQLAPVAEAAAAGGVLSKAAMAGNSPAALAQQAGQVLAGAQQEQEQAAAAAAPQVDPITEQVKAIAAAAREPGFLDKLRTETSPTDVKKFVSDLALAQSPSAAPAAREQALSRMQFAMDWAGQQVAPSTSSGIDEVAAVAGQPSTEQAGQQSASTTPAQRQAGADRDKDLQDQINAAPTAADRSSAQAQAQVNREQRLGAPAAAPSPAAAASPAADPGAQERLEAAAATNPTPRDPRALDGTNLAVSGAMKAIEARGGVASQAEAELLERAGAGRPFDRIDPALSDAAPAAPAVPSNAAAPAAGGIIVPPERGARDPNRLERTNASVEQTPVRPYTPLASEPGAAPANNLETIDPEGLYGTGDLAISSEPLPQRAAAAREFDTGDLDLVRSAERGATGNEQVTAPRVSIPAGAGTAQVRKRKETLGQLANLGFSRVERRDDGFFLVNPRGKQEFKLDGPADAQLARNQVALAIKAGAELANTDPTEGQKVAGNYKKGRVDFDGLQLAIENPIGSVRRGTAPDGTKWETPLVLAHYGDVTGTKSADGDAVDVYLVAEPRAGSPAFVFDQYNEDGTFDETKTVLGVRTQAEAERVYDAGFNDGSGPRRRRAVTEMPIEQFREWANSPAARKAASPIVTAAGDAAAAGKVFTVNFEGKPTELELVEDLPQSESAARGGTAANIDQRSADVLRGIAKAFGKEIVFYRGPEKIGDGFIMPNDPSRIYLNETSGISPLVVFGHELTHQLKRDNPVAHAALEAAVQARMKPDAVKQRLGEIYGDEQILEELTSDLGGDLMADPEFWQDVFARVQAADPKNAKSIVARMAEFFYRAVSALTRNVRTYGAADLVTDMDGIREAFKGAIAQYVQDQGIPKAAMQAEVMKAGADAKRSAEREKAAFMKAPDGTPTLLTEKQWHQVRTPEFKKWFGDWEHAHANGGVWAHDVSRAVGKNGEPLVLYHGTDKAGFMTFDMPQGVSRGNLGIFATPNRPTARSYLKGRETSLTAPVTRADFEEAGFTFEEGDDGVEVYDPEGYKLGDYDTMEQAVAEAADVEPLSRDQSSVYALFMNIRNPNEAFFEGANWDGSPQPNTYQVREGSDPDDSEAVYAEDGRSVMSREEAEALVAKDPENRTMIPAEDRWEGTDRVISGGHGNGHDGAIIHDVVDDGAGVSSYDVTDVYVAVHPNQVKSADFNQGSFGRGDDDIRRSAPRRVDPMEVSTRAPWSKKPAADAVKDMLLVGLDAMKAGKALEKNVALVQDYPNYRPTKTASTTDKQAERFIDHVEDNLLWLYDQVPAEIRDRSHLWYDGAQAIATRWAPQYGVEKSQVAGVMAVLSPQKDWFMNVDLARRVLDTVVNHSDKPWTREMSATARRIYDKPQYAEDVAAITGKPLVAIDDEIQKAMWVRAYDQTFNPSSYDLLSPEGDAMGLVTNNDGSNSRLAWGDFRSIAKAINIIEDGRLESISARLGGEHKVRNFYNNILVPNSPNGHVTIDTHAVAAGLIRPLSGSAMEVLHNFGGAGAASDSNQGTSGTYGLYAEAYRRAAAKRGVLPREMQSITWEAVRGLFTPGFKSQIANVNQTSKIWEQYQKGRASLETTRREITEAAGGVEAPSWYRPGAGSPAEEAGAGDARVVSGVQPPRGGAEPVPAGAGGAAAEAVASAQRPAAGARAEELPRPGAVRGGDGGVAEPRGQAARDAGREEPLIGLPDKIKIGARRLVIEPFAPAREAARKYMADRGEEYTPPTRFEKVVPERAKRIADAYDAMKHDPSNPEVKRAYKAMIDETVEQYRAALATGLKVDFIAPGQPDPYAASPRLATEDVQQNNHMWVFSTREGFGSNAELDVSDNPLLAPTEFEISGQTALANDLFRVVHDYFGHVKEGLGFRADGEENAWRSHAAMYSPLARRALTTETRGQNSWVNYGPHEETNRKANAIQTIFADQKVNLLPQWVTDEGRTDEPVRSAARAYPLAPAGERYAETNVEPTMMSPDEFLARVRPLEIDDASRDNIDDLKAHIEAGRKLDPLRIYADGKEDGRHRAVAARELGIEEVPVIDEQAVRSAPRGPIYYSQLERALTQVPERLATQAAPQWALWLKANAAKSGVRAEELEWSGIYEMLKMRGKDKITSADLAAWVRDNGVVVGETTLHEPVYSGDTDAALDSWAEGQADGDATAEAISRGLAWDDIRPIAEEGGHDDVVRIIDRAMADESEYADYTVPGGKNYRELLITLPKKGEAPIYKSSHWGGKHANILAHLRLDDRTDADGARVLFVDELQSDWGQDGKKKGFDQPAKKFEPQVKPGEWDEFMARMQDAAIKQMVDRGIDETSAKNVAEGVGHPTLAQMTDMQPEYQDLMARMLADRDAEHQAVRSGTPVPRAPFVGDTKNWISLAMKRALVEAAQGGYEKVAFISGKQAADLYSLRKQLSAIEYEPAGDGKWEVVALGLNGERVMEEDEITADRLEEMVGKDMANKIISGEGDLKAPGGWAVFVDGKEQYRNKSEKLAREYAGVADGDVEVRRVSDGYRDWRRIEGDDLEVGGEGMKAFYDEIVPQVARDLAKKLGGKVEQVDLEYDPNPELAKWEPEDGEGDGSTAPVQASKQLGITITDAVREKLASGAPLFSKPRITGDSGRAYTPEQLAMFENIGRTTEKPSIAARLKEARKDAAKKIAQGVVDQFRPIRDLGGEAYTLARLSKGAAGAFEALLHHGKLKLVENAYDADQTGGFIERVGNPLGAELEDFMQWIAANRAEQLTKEDREHLFTAADIAAGKSLADGQLARPYQLQNGVMTTSRQEAYNDSLAKFNEFNKNTMDMAEQSGLIDGEARKIWESEFYVPFYRVSEEDGAFMGTKIKGGIARQQAFKKLKGGKDKLNSDLLSNTLQNWAHLIDAAAKNRAARATLETAQKVGVAIEAPQEVVKDMAKSTGNKSGVVWFMDGGKQRHFLVEDPYLMTAINSLEYAGMKGPLMDALSTMKHWLTVGVTASPAFKVRNLIRDTISAIGITGLSYNPIKNLADGMKASQRDSQEYVSALASGGLIRFGTMMDGNASERIRSLVKRGVKESTILSNPEKVKAFYDRFVDPGVQAYHEIGNRGEEVNRSALYSQLRKQGVGHAEAALMARDMMDFSMQGTWASIRFLTQVVPFMNARLQGLYKLGRAAKEDPKRFALVTGAVALFSVALQAAYGDDDDWKKREDFDRDGFWWFKFGGTAFRIPKPFEIGAIASVAERGVELFTNDEFTAKRFADRLLHLVSDNLSMNPIPQAVKPIIDVYANKDSFSGRPIESAGMEKLQSEYRFNANTSMVARGASTALNKVTGVVGAEALSPVQIDSMLRGYFGWLGTFVVAGADMATRPLMKEPSRPEADYLKVVTQGFVRQLPEPSSKYVSEVYEQAKKLEEAYATHRQLLKDGKADEAAKFAIEHATELGKYKRVEAVKERQAADNKRIREIERSEATPAEKRERIQRIRDAQSRSAQAIY